jgi:hypothetical protein
LIASGTLLRQHHVIGQDGIAIVKWAAFSYEYKGTEREPEPCVA